MRAGDAWPGPVFRAAWDRIYAVGYGSVRFLTLVAFRRLFLVRRAGPRRELPRGGVLVCANHQSYLDPVFLQLVVRRRVTFVMTNDFYSLPFARSVFRLLRAVPLERSRTMRGSMRRAGALLRLGRVVAVFPEGRISAPGTLAGAQRGIAVLARVGRVPVVPMAVDGSARAWGRGARWLRTSDVRVAMGLPRRYVGEPSRERDQAFADLVRTDIDRLWNALVAARPPRARELAPRRPARPVGVEPPPAGEGPASP